MMKGEWKERVERRKGLKGSWERLGIKERQKTIHDDEQNKENIASPCQKRVRLLAEVEGNLEIHIEGCIRHKCQKVESPIISLMVEVASQNWPQVDK